MKIKDRVFQNAIRLDGVHQAHLGLGTVKRFCQSVADNLHFGSMLMWSEVHFSQFGFDIIAMMQGNYEAGRVSSFHGMGTSGWEQGQA